MPTLTWNYNLPEHSKVVTKDNATVMLEIVGTMRTVANVYEGTSNSSAKYLREQATHLETIALMMLEEC